MNKLDQFEALEAKATPAPWTNDNDIHVYAGDGPKSRIPLTWLGTCPTNMVISTGVPARDDAALIAAARNLAPAFIRLARAVNNCVADLEAKDPAFTTHDEDRVLRQLRAALAPLLAEVPDD